MPRPESTASTVEAQPEQPGRSTKQYALLRTSVLAHILVSGSFRVTECVGRSGCLRVHPCSWRTSAAERWADVRLPPPPRQQKSEQ
jgi:hypothetical protein